MIAKRTRTERTLRMPVDDQTIAALAEVSTSALANALDEHDVTGVIAGLAPLGPGMRCAGRAVTVQETTGARGDYGPEDFRVGDIIDAAGPGDLVVIANGGAPVSTWGGMASYAARAKNLAGLVVDGAVRDRDEIAGFGFPVFARHVVPTTGRRRLKVERIGAPVEVCGITVSPGDAIVADDTGVVCVPAAIAAAVAERARRLGAEDEAAMRAIDQGLSFSDAMAKFRNI
jgi:regulator of RNase E activity RraA